MIMPQAEEVPFWLLILYYGLIWIFLSLFHKKHPSHGFVASVSIIFILCLQSLVEDIAGKEAWLNYVQEHWVSGWWTIPIAIVGLLIVALVVFGPPLISKAEEPKEKENDRSS